MKRLRAIVVFAFLFAAASATADSEARFASVDVFIESAYPVAAWQFEFTPIGNDAQVVGVESGDSDAFNDAPYYDRDAVQQGRADRIVVADYSLADESELPSGRVRVTTLHLMLYGDDTPEFDTQLVVAASYQGTRINAEISIEFSAGSKQ